MGAVVQAFPSFQGLNGRSFALAFIIVVHLGLYAAFTSIHGPVQIVRPDIIAVPIPVDKVKPVEPIPVPSGPVIETGGVTLSKVDTPELPIDDSGWRVLEQPQLPGSGNQTGRAVEPVIVEPQIDARIGLREPPYPASEIRLNHTGTVMLSVRVMANGTVGEVRLVQSSGYPKLDEAALRVARTWRFIPGTSDGSAIAMWKNVPITFRLQN